eukprot:COSAG01_NODE_3572_length_5920_cov_2.877877_2_plen_293_part_00
MSGDQQAAAAAAATAQPAAGGDDASQQRQQHTQMDYAPELPTLPAAAAVTVPSLGIVKLAALTFFAVAGGPYGVEPLVKNGGALWSMLGMLFIPWIWGLPMALMTAELSTALPEPGGYVVWLHRAHGDFWAVQASVWTICNSFLDNATYPIMFVDYIIAFTQKDWETGANETVVDEILDEETGADDGSGWTTGERWLLGMCMVIPVLLLNLRGSDSAADGAMAFAGFVVLPFVVMFFMGLPEVSIDALTAPPSPKTADWGGYLTVLLWNTCGFDSAGTLAAEVKDPGCVKRR